MTLDEIKALIDAMSASDLAEVEVSKDGWTLRLTRETGTLGSAPLTSGAASTPTVTHTRPDSSRREPPASVKSAASTNDVTAPLSGIVYLGPFAGCAALRDRGPGSHDWHHCSVPLKL